MVSFEVAYFGVFTWYRTVQSKLFSDFKYPKIVGAFGASLLIPTRGLTSLTSPGSTQCPIDPRWVRSACRLLVKR